MEELAAFASDVELQTKLNAGPFSSCWWGLESTGSSNVSVKSSNVTNNFDLTTILQKAIYCSNLWVTHLCLEQGASPLKYGPTGRNALHCAASSGSPEAMKFVLDYLRGKSLLDGVNYRDMKCWTPLSIAVCKDFVPVVKVLLQECSGVIDLDLLYPHNCTPCREASTHSRVIHFAAVKANIEMFQLLVEQGQCNPLDIDESGRIPLHYGVARGDLEFVKMVLDNYPQALSMKDCHGRSSVHVAALRGWLPVLNLLLERGADPSIPDVWDMDAYCLAFNAKHFHCVDRIATWMEKHGKNYLLMEKKNVIVSRVSLTPQEATVAQILQQAFPGENQDKLARCVKRLGHERCLEFYLGVQRRTPQGKKLNFKVFTSFIQDAIQQGTLRAEDLTYIKAALLEASRARRRHLKLQKSPI